MCKECSANTCEERSDNKSIYFSAGCINPDSLCSNFILTDGKVLQTGNREAQVPREENHNNCNTKDPEEVCDGRNGHADVKVSAEATRAANTIVVFDDHPDDLTKAKRNDCKVVTTKAKTWQTNDIANQRSSEATREHRCKHRTRSNRQRHPASSNLTIFR